MPRERIELIKSEIAIKKDRLRKEKDILQAITPWIVAGIACLTAIAIVYFAVKGGTDISKDGRAASEALAEAEVKSSENYRQALTALGGGVEQVKTEKNILGKQPNNEESESLPIE